jgi:aspartyl-tRNA(Asn)/glutamyl-tRNA(Gln) amidotransferase subunit A
MSQSRLLFSSVRELSRLLRRREVSAVELARLFVDLLAAHAPRFNALAQMTPEIALKDARAADRALRAGDRRPLLGVPYGAKDIIAVAGAPTRWGAPPFRDQIFDFDATVITRLRAAGAVLLGKLATVEMAGAGLYGTPNASLNGPGLNPWNLEHWSGGSSSGPGSAVGAGLVPFALGSETRGSMIIPASFCGVSGLRPSAGAVSRHGVLPVSWSYDKVGIMGRSADECGIVLAAIAGRDPRDARTVEWRFRPNRSTDFSVGVIDSDMDAGSKVQRAFRDALRALRDLGFRVRSVKLPDRDYLGISQAIGQGETVGALEEFIRGPQLDGLVDEFQRRRLRGYLEQKVGDYARAVEQRLEVTQALRAVFAQVDVLVAPSQLFEAPRRDADLVAMRDRTFRKYSYDPMILGALAGFPSISVPMGFGERGLPLGICFTADVLQDPTVVRIASLFQRATDWHLRRPPAPVT